MSDNGHCPICDSKIVSRTPGLQGTAVCANGHTFPASLTNLTRLDRRLSRLTGEIHGLKAQLEEMTTSRDWWRATADSESRSRTQTERQLMEALAKLKGEAR